MTDRRRCPRTMPVASNTPSSSGPRCATQGNMRRTADASSVRLRSNAATPAMPHTSSSSRQTRESSPAVGVVMLNGHIGQPGALEPAREFIAAQVEGYGRNQVIEYDVALLAEGKFRDVAQVWAVRQKAPAQRPVNEFRGQEQR